MTSMWWLSFFFLDQNWNERVSEKLSSFGICCLHAPLILHHWGPSVIMNKPVNRIFQSSCGVLLSEWTVCQRRGCQLPSLTEREVAPNTVENSDDPIGSSRSQCLSAAWFLLTFSGSIYTIHHNSQVSFFFIQGAEKNHSNKLNKGPKQTNKPAVSNLVRGTIFEKKLDEILVTWVGVGVCTNSKNQKSKEYVIQMDS